MAEINSELDSVRITKLDELRAVGIEPYPPRLDPERSHTTAEAIQAFESADGSESVQPIEVTVAGRLFSRRIMGKVGFAHIEDASGRLQVFVRQDVIGQDVYDLSLIHI